MLSSFIVCTLVVMANGAMAVNQPAMSSMRHALFGIPPNKRMRDHEHPAPCKLPAYYTLDEVNVMTTVAGGSLQVEYDNFEGAYDDIAKKYSFKAVVDFFNRTEYSAKLIADYRKGKGYVIYTAGEEVLCTVIDVEGKVFPGDHFIIADATYIGETTIGDRDVVLDNWYERTKGGTEHSVKTVTRGECVPVGVVRRIFHPQTGEQIRVVEIRIYNFKLGICDPEKYFKIPEECKQEKALTEPTEVMQKHLNKFRRFHKL